MIETLYGKILDLNALSSTAIIECAGVGYKVAVTANTVSHLPSPRFAPDGTQLEGENIRIFTHLALREDAAELYGFYDREELDMFKLLISVSGVGPKAAMSILSLFTPSKLANAIISEDTKAISKSPGVGAKTSARVVLELKDKIKKSYIALGRDDSPVSGSEKISAANNIKDASEALSALGYSRSEITAAMKNATADMDVEDIIKSALVLLMK